MVEDQEGIRDLVQEFLRRKGYTVLQAVDGNEALRIPGEHKDQIHLLVTDVVMPNIGGRELVRCLTPLRPQMKVCSCQAILNTRARGTKPLTRAFQCY